MAKLSKLEQKAIELLPAIVTATTQEGGYLFTDPFNVAYLLEHGFIEQNAEITNPENPEELATRATVAGFEFVNGASAETQANEPIPERKITKMEFVIENVALPASKRGGRTGKSLYPFDALEVGQSFVVLASEKHPNPEKTLASTVSSAMKKYNVPDLDEAGIQKSKVITVPKTGEKRTVPAMKHTRVFGMRPETDANGVVIGARIGRTA